MNQLMRHSRALCTGLSVTIILVFVCEVQAYADKQVTIVRQRHRVEPMMAEWVRPGEYADNVTSALTKKLREFGVCNLPIRNKEYDFNAARFNNHLLGRFTYEDGLVVRIRNITRQPRKVMNFTEREDAILKFRICMENVTLVFDLQVDPNVSAMAVLTFPMTYIGVVISYNLAANKSRVKSMKTISVSNPRTAYIPDSILMTSLAYNARQSMSASLFTDVTSWVDNILRPMAESIVQESHYPLEVKRANRRPRTRAQCCQRNRDRITGNPLPLQGHERREREKCCKKHRAKISLKSGVETHQQTAKMTAKWDDPLDYLNDLTQLFGQRLKEYGVENLPVPDKFYNVNKTRYNFHLLGSTNYSNGFVINIQKIMRYYRHYIWYLKDDRAVIQFNIQMIGVEVLYDLNADLRVANIVGTAELSFPENLLEVFLFCNINTKEVGVASMKVKAVLGPLTTFGPDSELMRAIAYNARLSLAGSLFSDLAIWIDQTLKGLLESVVQELPFPLHFTQEQL